MNKNSHHNGSDDSLTPLAKRFVWVESADKRRIALLTLGGVSALLFFIDFVVHRHAYAPKEDTPGFYALVGFLTCALVVLIARVSRKLLLRPESYYLPYSVDAEDYPTDGLSPEAADNDSAASQGGQGS